MRVTRTTPSGGASGPSGTRPAADGFRLPGGPDAAAGRGGVTAASGPAGAAAVSGVDALFALQGLGGPQPGGRDRALRKGRRLLDALDRLHLSMLEGGPTSGNLRLLRSALSDPREESGDTELDEAINWAEVRVAVEAAKLERAHQGQP